MKVRMALVTSLLLASLGSTAQASEYTGSIHEDVRGMVNHTVVKKNHHGQRVVKKVRVVKKSAKRHVGKMKNHRPRAKSKQVTWKKAVKQRAYKQRVNGQRKFYTVKPGDNLHKVSRRTGVRLNKIIRLNRHKLSARNDFRLKVGQKLRLRKR